MDEVIINSWAEKSAEDVLAESFHEIRNPISLAAGYLALLKSANSLSLTVQQVQEYTELALNHVLKSQMIVNSVIQYLNEKRRDS